MKNFARTIPGEFKYRDRFRTSQEELFASTQEQRGNPTLEENVQQQREARRSRRSCVGSMSASRRSSLAGSGSTTSRNRRP